MNNNEKYISAQTMKVCAFPVMNYQRGDFKLQLIGPTGKSNWLDITPEQFKDIEVILFNGADYE
jgi:hypothetical protein